MLLAGLSLALSSPARAESRSCSIPFAAIGAKATADYQGEALAVMATTVGARLVCGFQKLEGQATDQGLWLQSTAAGGGKLRLAARAVGREQSSLLAATGAVSVEGKGVRFIRPGLVEEYSVSVDGVRQDFVVPERPAGTEELGVELELSGAKAEAAEYGAKLRLYGSARELAYSRLRAVDAAGKELAARLVVASADRLLVRVEDGDAAYPVRIDPTFSDANWVGMAGLPGADDTVTAIAVDGSGNVYAGGDFTIIGAVAANRIAKWDGSTWSPLGSGMNQHVAALAVSGSDLYAGGTFTTAGGVTANRVARWDGTGWSALGSGTDAYVYTLAVSGTNLYAGGGFTNAGGVTANRIARWDGVSWSALGSGLADAFSAYVLALAVSGSELYVGGAFTIAGGIPATNVARWNGNTWSALGSGAGGSVYALAASGTNLYAGGTFTTVGGVTAYRIAQWDGSAWSALGFGMNYPVNALTLDGTNLYAGGDFTTATNTGGSTVNVYRVAKWNGSVWSALGSGAGGSVYALAVRGTNLYAGGDYDAVGGVGANCLARWNGEAWSALGSGFSGVSPYVSALAVSGTDLYVGGHFTAFGATPVNRIAKWNGTAWSALGSGMDEDVGALAVSGTRLYAGGSFTTAGGGTVNCVACWDGSTWLPLGSGIAGGNRWVTALAVSGTNLYAAGGFTLAGNVAAANIARWDGVTWSALGSGMNDEVSALAVSGTHLYAGGSFTTAGGVTANHVARWDGVSWSALGLGTDSYVYALAASGTDLYVGGGFTTAGGVGANNLARWDGASWSALGLGTDGDVYTLAASGTDLYAGGVFTTAGGVQASKVARWDGSTWSALGSGVSGGSYPWVGALAADGAGHLFVGGDFYLAGTNVSPRLAQANLTDPAPAPPHFRNWRFTGGTFGCDVEGPAGRKLLVQASSDLKRWVTLRACQLTEAPWGFIDPESTLYPKRFYRLRAAEGLALLEQPRWLGGKFSLNLAGELGRTAVIEASTNLLNWTALATNLLGESPWQFSDIRSSSFPARFYRVRLE